MDVKIRNQKHITPKWVDRLLIAVICILALQLAFATVPMLWGWYPVVGRSMQPTFPFIWGYYNLEILQNPSGDLKVNNLVVVKGKVLGHVVKRVAAIDPKQGLLLSGDNFDRSLDSFFGADPHDKRRIVYVPFDEVVGRVTNIWSPRNAMRSDSVEGRIRNWAEFHFPPGWVTFCPTDTSRFVVETTIPGVPREQEMNVTSYSLQPDGQWEIQLYRGTAYGWLPDGTLKLMVRTTPSSFDIRTEDGVILEHVELE